MRVAIMGTPSRKCVLQRVLVREVRKGRYAKHCQEVIILVSFINGRRGCRESGWQDRSTQYRRLSEEQQGECIQQLFDMSFPEHLEGEGGHVLKHGGVPDN
jgi:hypothetical protein